jgi:quinol monooxygenase YgiN
MTSTAIPATSVVERTGEGWARVLELRRYRLHPGTRETLIDLFDREFVETQEAVGMRVIGQFRDLDDPDSFVWMRGFSDMQTRADALDAFYTGPVWAAHRDAANATMISSDDVLLLRPVPGGSLSPIPNERPAAGARGDGPGLVAVVILHLDPGQPCDAFAEQFDGALRQQLARAGAGVVATFVTEDSANTFPRLPVREGERVWVALNRLPDSATQERLRATLLDGDTGSSIRACLIREPELLRLKPTARSQMHG